MNQYLFCTLDDQPLTTLQSCFKNKERVVSVHSIEHCFEELRRKRFDFLFIDVSFFQASESVSQYKDQLAPFWEHCPSLEIILLTTKGTIRNAVHLVKAGASHYLTYPLIPEEVQYVIDSIRREQQLFSEVKYLRDQFWHRDSYAILKTNSVKMHDVFEKVRAVAATESTVLLLGETGTGKGVIANLIHRHSLRSNKQFIQIHCGAISDSILESEMFGHEKGAFTGATRRKLGKFEIASGGTIFLDEIGTISPNMQVNLLQVLQTRSFQRVGGESDIHVNIRLIAATNSDLPNLCKEGSFRQDLYFRLNVFPIVIPPLRERKEDIPLLVHTFLDNLNKNSVKKIEEATPEALTTLADYDWPGNIRELENIIERAFVLEKTNRLTTDCLPGELSSTSDLISGLTMTAADSLEAVRRSALEAVEKGYLAEVLARHHGRINRAAETAGVGVRQFHKLLQKYQIDKNLFKQRSSNAERKTEP